MKKTIIQKLGLSVAMLLTVLSASAAYDFEVDGIYYKFNDDESTVSVSSPVTSASANTVN